MAWSADSSRQPDAPDEFRRAVILGLLPFESDTRPSISTTPKDERSTAVRIHFDCTALHRSTKTTTASLAPGTRLNLLLRRAKEVRATATVPYAGQAALARRRRPSKHTSKRQRQVLISHYCRNLQTVFGSDRRTLPTPQTNPDVLR